ncbi:helix-turn-helix domain-containing protein [Parasphingorhabdus sp.]|uniref:TetR/AcrR family transcriptional regulator n=1 Tax=Parasphingorhabdus sp. TaxID=2709688 RepID=UPI002F92B97D
MKSDRKRNYKSPLRKNAAEDTRARILKSAKTLFSQRGIDKATIGAIAQAAGVAVSTVYALFKGKEGILAALMESALFGEQFAAAMKLLEGDDDPVRSIALTAHVSRAIYDGERSEIGIIRGASAFSAALRKEEQRFETLRLSMQEERINRLFASGRQRENVTQEEAQHILWMYTSRDVWRMLVEEGGWTPDRYQAWLSETLLTALTKETSQRS